MILKLLKWLPAIAAPLLGIVEAVVKFAKELLTLIVTILFPIIPNEKFKVTVTTIRALVDKIYDWISGGKDTILKAIGAI